MAHAVVLAGLVTALAVQAQAFLLGHHSRDCNVVKQPYGLPPDELVKCNGYPVSRHKVKTEDGYILTLFHISHGRKRNLLKEDKPVVLLQHGILEDAAIWLIRGPNASLPYLLADEGFDVWLGSSRGSRGGREHASLSIESNEFWDFSYEENGVYDLPAMIDFILKRSKQSSLHHVSHNMGSSMLLAMASERPEYRDKLRSAHLLGPIAYLDHSNSTLITTQRGAGFLINVLLQLASHGEVALDVKRLRSSYLFVCLNAPTMQPCLVTLASAIGYTIDTPQLNTTLLPFYLQYFPTPFSSKQLRHLGQGASCPQCFKKYDYGEMANQQMYGSAEPPSYNLKGMTMPTYIYQGKNDNLADIEDVNALIANLPNVQKKFTVDLDLFDNLDYMITNDVRTLVNEEIIENLKKLG